MAPRSLAEITEIALLRWCGVCNATARHPCNQDGNHLSRYYSAQRDGLITPAELALATRAAETQAPLLTALIRSRL